MNQVQTVILLGLVSLLTDISSEMVYPLLSLYLTTTLGATPAIIGIIEGIAESLASLLTLLGLHATIVGIGLLPSSVIGGLLWRMIGPSATFHFGCVMGILAAIGMLLVVPKLVPGTCPR
jgi:hypothetical protein